MLLGKGVVGKCLVGFLWSWVFLFLEILCGSYISNGRSRGIICNLIENKVNKIFENVEIRIAGNIRNFILNYNALLSYFKNCTSNS